MPLFIDTSSFCLNLAIILENKVYKKTIKEVNEHSKFAVDEINKLFLKLNKKPKDIEKIMVVNGPGSFTGLRIGVTIAKVFGWSLNKNVIPVSSLKSKILKYKRHKYYISIINAKNNNAYVGIYDKDYNTIIEKFMNLDELELSNYKNSKIVKDGNIDILRTYDYYKLEKGINAHKLVPNYLKKPQAELQMEGLWLENIKNQIIM